MNSTSKTRPSLVPERERLPPIDKKRSSIIATRKYRGIINQHLSAIGKHLELDDNGKCNFQCGKFVMAIEVPWNSNSFLLYTSVMKCLQTSTAVMRKALEINYVTRGTNSCNLALVPNEPGEMEFTLCRSQRIDGMSPSIVLLSVRTFLRTAVSIQKQLNQVLRSSNTVFTSSVSRAPPPPPPEQSLIPPPPPQERDMTPTISNKAADKIVPSDSITVTSITTRSKRIPLLKDLIKITLPLGVAVAAVDGNYSSKIPRKTTDIMRRFSCMASKALLRPRVPTHVDS